MTRACQNCEWWLATQARPAVGYCKAGPPIASYTWPLTNAFDWCGRFRLAERLTGNVDRRVA